MSIYPTKTASHLAIVGLVAFAMGIALREGVVVAWGGAILVAVALARAVTLVSVMRIRAAGFEMLWTGSNRLVRTKPGGVVTLRAEVRNRDTLSARFDKLRVVASPALETVVEPLAGEVPATGSVKLDIHVRALRVGYHGIYGLALEVRGAPGLFEVPLTFANPFGIEVVPRALARPLSLPHGGRSKSRAMAGRNGRQRGDGTDLHELREHSPGDSFRRIAWKASARRGKLVVKEFEREERDVVVVVVDASVELWSGAIGAAPLDRAVDLVATLVHHHEAQGDLVGLRVVGAREICRVEPDVGRRQLAKIASALMEHTAVFDVDRSGWDDSDLAVQVTEHLRPLDPRAVVDLRSGRIDKLVERANGVLSHAPFDRPMPRGRNELDAQLRRYAACFGLFVPARLEPDRGAAMANTLQDLARSKGKAGRVSLVHVVAPPPEAIDAIARAARRLKSRGVALRWTTPPVGSELSQALRAEMPAIYDDVERAVLLRAAVANRRGEQALRRLGIKVVRGQRMVHAPVDVAEDDVA